MSNWDDSETSDDDEQGSPKKVVQTEPAKPVSKPVSKPATNWDDSSDDDELNGNNNNNNNDNSNNKTTAPSKPNNKTFDSSSEEEPTQTTIETPKQKVKPKPKPRKKQRGRPKKKIVLNDNNLFDNNNKPNKKDKKKNNNDDSSDSSSSSDDNNTRKDGVKRDFQTDNDALFNGIKDGKINKNNNENKKDERPILSGNVKLSEYPIGSSHDIRNLAHEISGILQQKIFENIIGGDDIFIFFESLLNDHKLTASMDMVDAKNIVQLANKILKTKQKQFRATKTKKKKNNKPTLGKKWRGPGGGNNAPFREGGYNSDEFDAFG